MHFKENTSWDLYLKNDEANSPTFVANYLFDLKISLISVIPEIVPLLYSVSSLKATLVWTDPAAEPSSSSVLVNDLDLKIWFVGPNVVYPKTQAPSRCISSRENHRDNVEAVSLSSTEIGSVLDGTSNYTVAVRVTAHSLSSIVQVEVSVCVND